MMDANYFIDRNILTKKDLKLTYKFKGKCDNIIFNLLKEKIAYTSPKDPFAFWCIPKVIILGEDPYPSGADGLAFSTNVFDYSGIKGSLRNILLACGENKSSLSSIKPIDKNRIITKGNIPLLNHWRAQGVMLLNCYLTYPGKPKVWQEYTCDILKTFNKAIMIAWGNTAQKKLTMMQKRDPLFRPKILTFCHPSPQNGLKFTVCPNFKECNTLLSKQCLEKQELSQQLPDIVWQFKPPKEVFCNITIKRKIHCTWCVNKNTLPQNTLPQNTLPQNTLRVAYNDFTFIKKMNQSHVVVRYLVRIDRRALPHLFAPLKYTF